MAIVEIGARVRYVLAFDEERGKWKAGAATSGRRYGAADDGAAPRLLPPGARDGGDNGGADEAAAPLAGGRVKNWFGELGFGFIKPDDASRGDVFCHRTEIEDGDALEVGRRGEGGGSEESCDLPAPRQLLVISADLVFFFVSSRWSVASFRRWLAGGRRRSLLVVS